MTAVRAFLNVGAWAYLAAVVIRGARADEEPGPGWSLAAIGASLIVLALMFGSALLLSVALSPPSPATQPSLIAVGQLAAGFVAAGYVLILGWLFAGLPSHDLVGERAAELGEGSSA